MRAVAAAILAGLAAMPAWAQAIDDQPVTVTPLKPPAATPVEPVPAISTPAPATAGTATPAPAPAPALATPPPAGIQTPEQAQPAAPDTGSATGGAAGGATAESQDPDATARAILRQLRAPRAPSVEETRQPRVREATGGVLRALDMMTGRLEDLKLGNGETVKFERLTITMRECRYPVDNPSGDAFAYLIIRDQRDPEPRFQGWMIASSPALSAMDHPRYDVWVLRCNTPSGKAASGG